MLEISQSNNANVASLENVQKNIYKTVVRKEKKKKKKRPKKGGDNDYRCSKTLRVFSILEHIDDFTSINSEQPYFISMQDY